MKTILINVVSNYEIVLVLHKLPIIWVGVCVSFVHYLMFASSNGGIYDLFQKCIYKLKISRLGLTEGVQC